jgi:pSer/pThr/pTyr-binding forkhead associated (FHA) protein
MKIKLIATHNGRRTVIPLKATVAVVGRAHGNAVRIPSAEVSRRHCRLVVKDGGVSVEDMDSVNGTFLNGKKLSSAQPVYPGDKIDIGPVSFIVEYEPSGKARGNMAPKEPSADLLEALADGDVMDAESIEDLPELEVMDSLPRRPGTNDLDLELEPSRPNTDALEPLAADFDFDATPWRMPDGGDLRDLLEEMNDEPTRPAKSKKRRDN